MDRGCSSGIESLPDLIRKAMGYPQILGTALKGMKEEMYMGLE